MNIHNCLMWIAWAVAWGGLCILPLYIYKRIPEKKITINLKLIAGAFLIILSITSFFLAVSVKYFVPTETLFR